MAIARSYVKALLDKDTSLTSTQREALLQETYRVADYLRQVIDRLATDLYESEDKTTSAPAAERYNRAHDKLEDVCEQLDALVDMLPTYGEVL